MLQIFYIMLQDAICRAGCKGNVFETLKPLCISSSPQFLWISSIPSPSHSPFSVFPSFLIHFLCITPLLSTPIYSALPPSIFHKHTLYFSLPPSVTLLCPFPPFPLLQCIMKLFSSSPLHPLYYCFIFSPISSSHMRHFFLPYLYFLSS